jgi:ribosomal protein L9
MNNSLKPVKVAGQLYWNKYLTEFNTHFNEDNIKYEATLCHISDAAKAKLEEELGIKVKYKPEQGNFICAKSKFVFEPVDEDGNKLDPKTFGNGTQAIALVGSYRHKLSAKHGAAPTIKKLIVTKVVPYEGSGTPEEDDEIL